MSTLLIVFIFNYSVDDDTYLYECSILLLVVIVIKTFYFYCSTMTYHKKTRCPNLDLVLHFNLKSYICRVSTSGGKVV